MFRPINSLPLPGLLLKELQQLGFVTYEDVCSLRHGQFRVNGTVLELTRRFCEDPYKFWRDLSVAPEPKNAYSLFQEECNARGIETFCKSLDQYMDGGVPLQRITELNGSPGSGKTQLCLQLCVSVQLPRAFDGTEGQAVYFDTCDGFILSRLSVIAEATVNYCSMLARNNQQMLEAMKFFSKDSILQNIFYVHCLNYIDLIANVIYLKKFLQINKQVKLIVVDNINYPFHNIVNSLEKVRLTQELVENLRNIAYEFKVAVVVTNNMTTRIDSKKEAHVVPALGESFAHTVHYRFTLGRLKNNFVCVSGKNVNKPSETIPFQITKSGIRGVD